MVGSRLVYLLVFVVSCTTVKDISKEKIQVKGKALDAKRSGIVKVNDSVFYYVSGIDYWNEKFKGKDVVVVGILQQRKDKEADDPNIKLQIVEGKYMVIQDAKYRLLNGKKWFKAKN